MRVFSAATKNHIMNVTTELCHRHVRWALRQHSLNIVSPFVDFSTTSATRYSSARMPICHRLQQCEKRQRLKCHGRAYSSCFHYSQRSLNDAGHFQLPTESMKVQGVSHSRPSASISSSHSETDRKTSTLPRSAQVIFLKMFPTTRFTTASHNIKNSDTFQKDTLSFQKALSSDFFFSRIHQGGSRKQISGSRGVPHSFRDGPASNTTRASAWVGLKTLLDILSDLRPVNAPRPDNKCRSPAHEGPQNHTNSDSVGVKTATCEDHERYKEAHRLWVEVRSKLARDQAILADIYQRINKNKLWSTALNEDSARQDMFRSMWLLFSLVLCMCVWHLVEVNEYIELMRQINYVSYTELKKNNKSENNDDNINSQGKKGRGGGNGGCNGSSVQASSSTKETKTSRTNVKIE